MARASSLYPTMLVRVIFVQKYQKVVKAKVLVLQSPRAEERFQKLELVAFATDEDLFSRLALAKKGMELMITGKREISTFRSTTKEQIILHKLVPANDVQPDAIEKMVGSF